MLKHKFAGVSKTLCMLCNRSPSDDVHIVTEDSETSRNPDGESEWNDSIEEAKRVLTNFNKHLETRCRESEMRLQRLLNLDRESETGISEKDSANLQEAARYVKRFIEDPRNPHKYAPMDSLCSVCWGVKDNPLHVVKAFETPGVLKARLVRTETPRLLWHDLHLSTTGRVEDEVVIRVSITAFNALQGMGVPVSMQDLTTSDSR